MSRENEREDWLGGVQKWGFSPVNKETQGFWSMASSDS